MVAAASRRKRSPPRTGPDKNFTGQSLTIINPGTGYNGTPITLTATGNKKTCNGVTATTTFGHFVNTLTLGAPGGNYRSAPAVTLGGGIGSGVLVASASATLDNPPANSQSVTKVTVTNPGSGYTTAPTVTLSGGGGTGALAHAVIGSVYKILTGLQSMTDNGSGYSDVPKVTITRGAGDTTGTGAEAYATVDGVSGLTYGMVYQLTSLAVTGSGARAMTQMEVATPVRGLSMTGGLTLAGPQPTWTSCRIQACSSLTAPTVPTGPMSRARLARTSPRRQPGCTTTPNPARPAIGAYDDPNASTTPPKSSVELITDAIPPGRTNNYQGSGPSPDVQNVYGSLGDTLTSPTGLLALSDAVKSAAGANVFPEQLRPGSSRDRWARSPIR